MWNGLQLVDIFQQSGWNLIGFINLRPLPCNDALTARSEIPTIKTVYSERVKITIHPATCISAKTEEGLSRTLDVHVAWIRNKLNIGAQSVHVRLVAIHGYGYRLMQVPNEAQ